MEITINLSEILLYLDLMKKKKKRPSIQDLNVMVYFLEDYDQVKMFYNKLNEHNFNPPFKFFNGTLIHFIEDYEDCKILKDKILQKTRRRYSVLFVQQILLSNSKEEALKIIKEAKDYGIDLTESWASNYDSLWKIKRDQEYWRENYRPYILKHVLSLIDEFQEMKSEYFEKMSLKELKEMANRQPNKFNKHNKSISTSYNRNIYIKEFARRVSQGICQLCDKEAPFKDKYGVPFLEVHHINYLSKGGSDTIDNVVALCPNCHRKIHQLELNEDLEKMKVKALNNSSL
ncbi:HNH endonuclease [Alkalihalobacillus sp. LMS39]|uniref:HNH endonuclease n=1 Tax=Alkalihalobacillus sp. LMS39 TaxID=2924032 RepID=UPI001FB4748D|nr:HNH endonuclease [Alkalihalobacillus sp. LMS39]UOE94400.1 HNH endonuclease [Alkalihalobacillus sp. LMS39]